MVSSFNEDALCWLKTIYINAAVAIPFQNEFDFFFVDPRSIHSAVGGTDEMVQREEEEKEEVEEEEKESMLGTKTAHNQYGFILFLDRYSTNMIYVRPCEDKVKGQRNEMFTLN